MTIVEIMTCILIILIMVCILACVIFNLRETAKKNEGMLKVQIEAAKVKRTDHVDKLSFDDCIKIINHLIGFYVSSTILLYGLQMKNSDELSTILDELVINISTQVTTAMSNELTACFLTYVSNDYLMVMIKDTTRIVLTAKLDGRVKA